MWHDAVLVAGKDLRIEALVCGLWQVVPFALLVLVLLAFAIGPDQAALRHAAPGIFWVALLPFSTVLAIQRSVAVESGEGTRVVGCASRASTRPGSSSGRPPRSASSSWPLFSSSCGPA